jgi:hypothetical protein
MALTLTPQKWTVDCIQVSSPVKRGNGQVDTNGILNEIVVYDSVQKPRIKDKHHNYTAKQKLLHISGVRVNHMISRSKPLLPPAKCVAGNNGTI